MIEPLADLSHFPPAAKYSYLDAASVSLTHKGAAASISDWQRRLAEEGTVAFDERDEVEVFDQLSDCGARLFNTTSENIASVIPVRNLDAIGYANAVRMTGDSVRPRPRMPLIQPTR